MAIWPSILAADFANLAGAAAAVPSTDWLHVDCMDGHFVANHTIGPPVVASLARAVDQRLDCHLQMTDPDRTALPFCDAGADGITFHAEAVRSPVRLAREIRARGVRAGLALAPETPVEPYLELTAELDLLLLMTVEPGFGGQPFLPATLAKVEHARRRIDDLGLSTLLQVDGGIDRATIGRCARAGADVFVAGTSVFGAADPDAAVAVLRSSVERAAEINPRP